MTRDINQTLELVHAAGWCVGNTAFVTEAGLLVWCVSGRNGENVVPQERSRAIGRLSLDPSRRAAVRASWAAEHGIG
jgi:hypothetical protein